MSKGTTVISRCRDLRLNESLFKKYNRPARILALLAIVIPLGIVVPTSSEDETGEIDYTTSPYAAYAGIIFLAGVVIAYFLSRKANGYKIRNNQEWAIKALNAYENLSEYEREKAPEDYLDTAVNSLDDLIDAIRSKIDETLEIESNNNCDNCSSFTNYSCTDDFAVSIWTWSGLFTHNSWNSWCNSFCKKSQKKGEICRGESKIPI